jgi:hypothetical protein
MVCNCGKGKEKLYLSNDIKQSTAFISDNLYNFQLHMKACILPSNTNKFVLLARCIFISLV